MKAAKTKTETPPPPRLTLGLPVKRPPQFLCYLCGYHTLVKADFVTHHQEAHP